MLPAAQRHVASQLLGEPGDRTSMAARLSYLVVHDRPLDALGADARRIATMTAGDAARHTAASWPPPN